ncbi:hypothetical protein BDY19DRAFT_1010758 [Irpex rosettiformis]|uniref:Uncharacterized protein n=1 Tax=Irpex rosettiformis TaxID=378272 RepID=A0ACB8U0V9_9APHY|nr:hypothetical protein BDY19DRAFT_1010758 [Irpex rosettiformis]
MATVTHYIRSDYNPEDRKALEIATGQVPSNPDILIEGSAEEPVDPWQTEKAFGVERRLSAAPRFVPAAVSYDEVNNMLGGMPQIVLQTPAEEPREDVSRWYRSLKRSRTGADKVDSRSSTVMDHQKVVASSSEPSKSTSQAITPIVQPRPDKGDWFITRALLSQPPSTLSSPLPTLADILDREPPVPKKPVEPPVFLTLGPSNKGWGMLQQQGWSEGEGLGANVIHRAAHNTTDQKRPITSSSRSKSEAASVPVKTERQEVQLDSDGEIYEMRHVEVVDLTLTDSDSDVEKMEDRAVEPAGSLVSASHSREPSPHSKPLLTPIPTILKSDRLGIGLKAKKVGPYKESKKRITHNQAALAAHIRATEEMRRMKNLVGRGSRGFARMAKAESDQRRQLLATLNAPWMVAYVYHCNIGARKSAARLELRAFRDDGKDMDFMMELSNDLKVQQMTWNEFVVPRGPKFKDTISGWIENSLFTGIVCLRFGHVGERIGNVAINSVSQKNREGSLVINILPEFWGNGYGSEILECVIDHAFKNLALHRLSLGVFSYNQRAVATYKKLGFVEEGCLRKSVWWDGEWKDVLLLALLEDEWFERCSRLKQNALPA